MAALAYRDDKILARNLLSHPFFCLTPAEPFFRPDRSSIAPSCRVAVKDGRAFRGHPKGLSLTAASTMARWLYRSGRRSCVAAEHASSPRRSSRLPGSRSRSLYRSPGTPIGKSIDYLDFATIKLMTAAAGGACVWTSVIASSGHAPIVSKIASAPGWKAGSARDRPAIGSISVARSTPVATTDTRTASPRSASKVAPTMMLVSSLTSSRIGSRPRPARRA